LNVISILGHRDFNASLSSTARRRNTCQDLLKKQTYTNILTTLCTFINNM
jgi:hypothetical protein